MHIKYSDSIRKDPLGRTGFIIFLFIAALGILGPLLSPYSFDDYSGRVLDPPGAQHILGTNDVGQDVFTGIASGAGISLVTAFITSLISIIISLFAGTAAAIKGGRTDTVILRTADIFMAIPPVIVAILLAAFLSPGLYLLILIFSVLFWPGGMRVIRSQVLSLKEQSHIKAAVTFGASNRYLIIKHFIPELFPLLTAQIISTSRRAILMEAGLSFLGVTAMDGVSWGMMINHSLRFTYTDAWIWWLLPTGAALSLTLAALSFTGYALEKAMDPRLRHTDHPHEHTEADEHKDTEGYGQHFHSK